MKQIQKKRRISWFRILIFGILAYTIYFGFSQQRQLDAIHLQTETARKQVEQLKQENTNLKQECNLLKDPKYVEKLAREELGLAKPGEVPYLTTGKK
jgi:cell division protein FtsL